MQQGQQIWGLWTHSADCLGFGAVREAAPEGPPEEPGNKVNKCCVEPSSTLKLDGGMSDIIDRGRGDSYS